jgi:hypothetical protein
MSGARLSILRVMGFDDVAKSMKHRHPGRLQDAAMAALLIGGGVVVFYLASDALRSSGLRLVAFGPVVFGIRLLLRAIARPDPPQ